MGIEVLLSIVKSVAGLLNVVGKFLNKEGILVMLEAMKPVKELQSANLQLALAEAKDLDASEQEKLAVAFKEALKLPNPEIEAKIERGVDALCEAAGIAGDGLALYEKVVILVAKVKSIFA